MDFALFGQFYWISKKRKHQNLDWLNQARYTTYTEAQPNSNSISQWILKTSQLT